MPATNALQPPLKPEERAIVKSYGDWTSFCLAFGLKPFNPDENEEALQIVRTMAREDARS